MAHHKSALKRIQIGQRNRERNKYYLTTMRTFIKQVISSDKKEEALTKYNAAASFLDKMVSKNIIHKNMAANKKSRLMKFVNSLA